MHLGAINLRVGSIGLKRLRDNLEFEFGFASRKARPDGC
jgi:hypothetical protein